MRARTPQAMLNRTFQWHIVDKNPPGMDEKTSDCLFDGGYNSKEQPVRCAIGCQLNEKELAYFHNHGDNTGQDDFNIIVESMSEMFKHFKLDINDEFTRELQGCHDDAAGDTNTPGAFRKQYKRNLNYLAGTWDLEMPVKG